ncbi:hypothetical protein TNCV_1401691 [Trichonephila clavipes]|nr:hypothetical protein TNCV_1401691 [Trichonephila clavipes]
MLVEGTALTRETLRSNPFRQASNWSYTRHHGFWVGIIFNHRISLILIDCRLTLATVTQVVEPVVLPLLQGAPNTIFQQDNARQHVTCDEVHFWLNGYVNKQNCRIWSEAIPQVYVETPLHPEKLTVRCALWAGGILLQKR